MVRKNDVIHVVEWCQYFWDILLLRRSRCVICMKGRTPVGIHTWVKVFSWGLQDQHDDLQNQIRSSHLYPGPSDWRRHQFGSKGLLLGSTMPSLFFRRRVSSCHRLGISFSSGERRLVPSRKSLCKGRSLMAYRFVISWTHMSTLSCFIINHLRVNFMQECSSRP
jgi:hypothetical protein